MRNVRAGHAKLVSVQDGVVTGEGQLDLTSPAFAEGARLPERVDGEIRMVALSSVSTTDALLLAMEGIPPDPTAERPGPLVSPRCRLSAAGW